MLLKYPSCVESPRACRGYWIFLALCVAFLYNLAATIAAVWVAESTRGGAMVIVVALVFLIFGIPGAWLLWYKRMYRALATDGAWSFASFFFFFLIHIAYCVFAAVAPDFKNDNKFYAANAGFLPAFTLLKGGQPRDKIAAYMYFAGGCVWSALAFVSLIFLGKVYMKFRGKA
jgi:secretory carrier-associated membrane protein